MDSLDEWYRQLRWNATAHGWIAHTDESEIFVSEHTYHEQVCAYFARQGKERKTYSQIMRVAEEEWRQQQELEQAFQRDINFWLTDPLKGVSVRRRGETEEERWKRRREQEINAHEHLLRREQPHAAPFAPDATTRQHTVEKETEHV